MDASCFVACTVCLYVLYVHMFVYRNTVWKIVNEFILFLFLTVCLYVCPKVEGVGEQWDRLN